MSDAPPNPHDAYFRRVMTRSADAACEFRAVLPEALVARLDWSVLEPLSCSFVSAELQSRYTDILYRTRLSGRDAFIYLLMEHQSTVDPLMALRMLGYLVDIWRHYIREHPNTRALPPVIPLVVHNNSTGRAWHAETEVYDLIDLDEPDRAALSPWLPRLRFLLDDVATVDVRALRARNLTPATLLMLVLQQIAPGNFHLGVEMKPLVEDLRAMASGPSGKDDLVTVLKYILTVSETDLPDLGPLMDQVGPRAKEAIMTTADRLRAEGEARARAEALLELLTVKFGSLPARVVHTVRGADLEQVCAWFSVALTAGSLEEIFGAH